MSSKLKFKDKIKLVISDFDGIFTDGSIYINDDEKFSSYKKINFSDVMGASILLKNEINLVIISGEKSGAISYLKKKFPKILVYEGIRDKLTVLKNIINDFDINLDNAVYIGDDINDIECLNYVSNKITVDTANYKVKDVQDIQIVEKDKNGFGAFRKVVDEVILHNEKFC